MKAELVKVVLTVSKPAPIKAAGLIVAGIGDAHEGEHFSSTLQISSEHVMVR